MQVRVQSACRFLGGHSTGLHHDCGFPELLGGVFQEIGLWGEMRPAHPEAAGFRHEIPAREALRARINGTF